MGGGGLGYLFPPVFPFFLFSCCNDEGKRIPSSLFSLAVAWEGKGRASSRCSNFWAGRLGAGKDICFALLCFALQLGFGLIT